MNDAFLRKTTLIALLLSPALAPAGSLFDAPLPSGEVRDIEHVHQATIPGDRWQAGEVTALEAQLHTAFPPAAMDRLLPPEADSGPLVNALLTVLQHEPALPHARYRLRYAKAEVAPMAGPPMQLSVVEVARFNLGPARRSALIAELGAEYVAPEEHFGTAPDVIWRLVTYPLRGHTAVLSAAGRRPLSASETLVCLGRPCTQADPITGQTRDWPQPESRSWSPTLRPEEAALLQAGLSELGLYDHHDSGASRWRGFEWPETVTAGTPFVEIIIENGLSQGGGSDLVIHYGQLMDHEISDLWLRMLAMDTGMADEGGVLVSQDVERWPRPDLESLRH